MVATHIRKHVDGNCSTLGVVNGHVYNHKCNIYMHWNDRID